MPQTADRLQQLIMSKLKILREKSQNELKRQANAIMAIAAALLFIISSAMFFLSLAYDSDKPIMITIAVAALLIAIGMVVMIIINRRAESKTTNRFMAEVSKVASTKAAEIDDVSPEQFAIVCAMMFVKCGYNVKIGTPDTMEGASLVIKKRGIRKARVRCEMAIGRIGPDIIKEFAMSKRFHRHCDMVLITNGYLMAPAKELAEEKGISVIDRDRISKILESAKSKPIPKNYRLNRDKR